MIDCLYLGVEFNCFCNTPIPFYEWITNAFPFSFLVVISLSWSSAILNSFLLVYLILHCSRTALYVHDIFWHEWGCLCSALLVNFLSSNFLLNSRGLVKQCQNIDTFFSSKTRAPFFFKTGKIRRENGFSFLCPAVFLRTSVPRNRTAPLIERRKIWCLISDYKPDDFEIEEKARLPFLYNLKSPFFRSSNEDSVKPLEKGYNNFYIRISIIPLGLDVLHGIVSHCHDRRYWLSISFGNF